MKRMGYRRLNSIQIALIGTVDALVILLGGYHITHQGMVSGITELTAAVLLTLSLLLPRETRRHFRRYSDLQITLLGIVDVTAIIFSILHFSTPDGLRSGILELIAFIMLTTAIFLPDRR